MLGTPFWAAYLLQRYVSGKSRPGWAERWGRYPHPLMSDNLSRRRVWVHAVSAGEVVAAVPIVREMKSLLPDFEIVFSVTTPAGMEMAEKQARPYVDGIFYFPIDLPWVARRAVKQIDPIVFVSLESELWPNVLHELKRLGASTVMVNGRITERSYRRVRRFGGGLFRWMISNMDQMLVQSEADAARLRSLGRAGTAERISVIGNSKFDQEIVQMSSEAVDRLRTRLKIPGGAPVFVAGSTRSPQEEAEVLRAYLQMKLALPELCLIIAPRQIQRAGELSDAMRAAGLEPVRMTQITEAETARHLVLDTMGDLANVYALASFAFVGNSWPPVVNGGGQNLVQPLAHGKPVFFGPKTATVRSEVALATEAGVGFEVESAADLARIALGLLQDVPRLEEINRVARALIASQRGVSRRYAEQVAALVRQRAEQA